MHQVIVPCMVFRFRSEIEGHRVETQASSKQNISTVRLKIDGIKVRPEVIWRSEPLQNGKQSERGEVGVCIMYAQVYICSAWCRASGRSVLKCR